MKEIHEEIVREATSEEESDSSKPNESASESESDSDDDDDDMFEHMYDGWGAQVASVLKPGMDLSLHTICRSIHS